MENTFKKGLDGRDITLLASRSKAGGKGTFPRIPSHTPVAGLYEDIELGGTASLYSYTIIHPNPKLGTSAFVLALVDYPGETRVFGRLSCPAEDLRIGMSVHAIADGGGVGSEAVYRFVKAEEPSA